jgi:hypothetical protein
MKVVMAVTAQPAEILGMIVAALRTEDHMVRVGSWSAFAHLAWFPEVL